MTHIFYLKAVGADKMFATGNIREIETSTCFPSEQAANSRIPAFKEKLAELLEPGFKVTIKSKEVVYE